MHSKYEINYPPKSDLLKDQITELKECLSSQQLIFTKETLKSKLASIAFLRV